MSLRVLLTDADTILLSIYRGILIDQHFEVRTAATALECLAELRQWRPDVLVLDAHLPWGSGLGVLALMREGTDVPTVPVLLLSADAALAQRDDLVQGELLLLKPVPTRALIDAIRLLARGSNPNGLPRGAAPFSPRENADRAAHTPFMGS